MLISERLKSKDGSILGVPFPAVVSTRDTSSFCRYLMLSKGEARSIGIQVFREREISGSISCVRSFGDLWSESPERSFDHIKRKQGAQVRKQAPRLSRG